jgi:hypothetical protein
MPPNNVPDADLKTLVEWILALKWERGLWWVATERRITK